MTHVKGHIPKIIVVSGGVISGVGKGTATAAIGRILQEYGYSVTAVKIDPYINYDAGTLRPTEHGEVWVTEDGGEIDQDLGNYERFLQESLPKKNNITTGQIYKELIDKERKGEFLGQTVEFIPHVINEIKRRILDCANSYDITLIEIGGTIGDYQNFPFLFATKSLEIELGKDSVCHILVTYLPVPDHVGEMKTKPTQQAIRTLNETGIFPDFVLCRAHQALDDVRKKKIEAAANINMDYIISAPDVETIYRIPLNFEKENLGKKILERLNLPAKKKPNWKEWETLVKRIEKPSKIVKVAMIGKYVDIGAFTLTDSYISVNQSIEHAAAALNVGIKIEWIDAKSIEKNGPDILKNYKGIIVPGGFGTSGVEGKITAIKYARENDIPFLGLCFGLQLACVEYARNVCNLAGAHSTEIDPKTSHPVIDVQPSQKEILEKSQYGATMRLGSYAAILKKSKILDLYNQTGRLKKDMEMIKELRKKKGEEFRLGLIDKAKDIVLERHRHRYEVNPKYVEILEKEGLIFSGHHLRHDNTPLMEFIELPKHRCFIATQAHPEFKSRFGDPSPLYYGFVKACGE